MAGKLLWVIKLPSRMLQGWDKDTKVHSKSNHLTKLVIFGKKPLWKIILKWIRGYPCRVLTVMMTHPINLEVSQG